MQASAVKTLPFILFALAMLALAGCNGTTVFAGASTLGIIGTKPAALPPADTADQIAQHDSWCYETLGYAECYAHPQDVPPNRLINVDPANKYPLTAYNYNQALAGEK
jgi:hypothetical protein